MSERRAYRLVGLSRDSYRHPPQPDAQTAALQGKIVEIAQVRCPLRLPAHPRSVAAGVSRRQPQACVYRLYSEARLDVRKRKKVRRAAVERAPLQFQPLHQARCVIADWRRDFDEVRPQCLSEPCTARPRGHKLEFGSGGQLMTEAIIYREYRGHTITIRVRSTVDDQWTWTYSIDGIGYRDYGDRPESTYDVMLNAAIDEGRRRIDAFEDRLDGGPVG